MTIQKIWSPIEPAFYILIQEDQGIIEEAFSKKVVLVTPTTLLATLKIVESIWRQEKQSKHAIEIADLVGVEIHADRDPTRAPAKHRVDEAILGETPGVIEVQGVGIHDQRGSRVLAEVDAALGTDCDSIQQTIAA